MLSWSRAAAGSISQSLGTWERPGHPAVHLRNLRDGDARLLRVMNVLVTKPFWFLKLAARGSRFLAPGPQEPSSASRAGRGRGVLPPRAAPSRGRAGGGGGGGGAGERRGDWLRRAETSGSRGPSGRPARRGAVGSSAPGEEELSSAVPPSAAAAGLRR